MSLVNSVAHEHPSSDLLTGPAAWTGGDLARRPGDWIIHLTPEQIAEIEQAADHALAAGRPPPSMTRDDFPLPRTAGLLASVRSELEDGRGFVLIRGLPAEGYPQPLAEAVFWGVGLHLGTAVPQSRKGDVLGHVRDLGGDIADPHVRGYETRARLLFHTDRCDCVGLMCLRGARSGGASRVVSALSVYNRLAEQRPDLLSELMRPLAADRRGEEPPGAPGWVDMPVFMIENGVFAVRYVRDFFESAQRFAEVPRLTSRQIEALDLFDATAADPDLALDMDFQPGDIQFLNSYVTLHSRTAFVDDPSPDRRRRLLRLWLAMPNSRRLPSPFLGLYDTVEAGAVRGGVPSAADEGS
ncbi:MAG: TauD/TfdA family dioxygenase [Inquilinaceae bacterium]